MKALIAWMARHPVAANLLMGLILVAGVVNMLTMKQEVFPLIELDVLEVRVTYQGAAPDEVEEAIVQRIEEQIEGIDGIDQVTSIAVQGTGVVRIELARGVPVSAKLDEVKAAIDRITTFPVESERPEVKQLASRQRVVELALYGDASESVLRELAYRVKDELAATSGISLVQVARVRDYEVSIEVSSDALRAYGLTLQDLAATVRRSSLDLPSGDIKAAGESILLRAKGRNYDRADFENIVVVSGATGAKRAPRRDRAHRRRLPRRRSDHALQGQARGVRAGVPRRRGEGARCGARRPALSGRALCAPGCRLESRSRCGATIRSNSRTG